MMLKVNRHLIKIRSQPLLHQTSTANLLHSCYQSEYACLGIEMGDMLVVEKNDSLFIGDLVVLEKQDGFHIYEFAGVSGNEFVFMALDSKSGKY